MTDYCAYLQLQPEGVADCRFGAVGHPLDGSLAEAVVPLNVAKLGHLGLKVPEFAQFLHEAAPRVEQDVEEDVLLSIPVLVHEAGDVVKHAAGVVADTELLVPPTPVLPLHIVRVGLELRVQVGEVGLVAALRHVALLRQQLQQTPRRPLDQLQAPAVVREADVRELDLLGRVLQTENMNFIDSNNILGKKTIFNH